jgi:hypothetical protein
LASHLEKRACLHCQDGLVWVAAAPREAISTGFMTDRAVIDTVLAKYTDHVPLYRQSAIREREAAAKIPTAELYASVLKVGYLLYPLAEAMRLELVRAPVVCVTETLLHLEEGARLPQAYLLKYSSPGGCVVFAFHLGSKRGPKRQRRRLFLGAFAGVLWMDRLAGDSREEHWIHLGPWYVAAKVAAILSVLETCRRMAIPARQYLEAVLPSLANGPVQLLSELTPTSWAARNMGQASAAQDGTLRSGRVGQPGKAGAGVEKRVVSPPVTIRRVPGEPVSSERRRRALKA